MSRPPRARRARGWAWFAGQDRDTRKLIIAMVSPGLILFGGWLLALAGLGDAPRFW